MPAVRPSGVPDLIDRHIFRTIEWVCPVQSGRTSSTTISTTPGATTDQATPFRFARPPGADAVLETVGAHWDAQSTAGRLGVDGKGWVYGGEFAGPAHLKIDQLAELVGAGPARPGPAVGGQRPNQMEVGS